MYTRTKVESSVISSNQSLKEAILVTNKIKNSKNMVKTASNSIRVSLDIELKYVNNRVK